MTFGVRAKQGTWLARSCAEWLRRSDGTLVDDLCRESLRAVHITRRGRTAGENNPFDFGFPRRRCGVHCLRLVA
eukprot:4609593-Prymnesium_polylepis.1